MLKKTSVLSLAMLFIFTSFTGCLGGDDDDDDSSTSYSEDLIIAFEVKDDYENPMRIHRSWQTTLQMN